MTTNDTTMALGLCAAVAAIAIGIGTFAANYRLGIDLNDSAYEAAPSFKMDGIDCTNYHGEGRKSLNARRGE